MKIIRIFSLLAASAALASCGGNSAQSASGPSETLKKVVGASAPPAIEVPTGPPPERVIVRELKKGRGAMLQAGQSFTLNYVSVEYRSGKRLETHWEKSGGFSWRYGTGEVVKGWETGLKGMRVGGRRELVVPSRLAYGAGAVVYVIELLEVQ
jgi:peptidylprolyl isomerase